MLFLNEIQNRNLKKYLYIHSYVNYSRWFLGMGHGTLKSVYFARKREEFLTFRYWDTKLWHGSKNCMYLKTYDGFVEAKHSESNDLTSKVM